MPRKRTTTIKADETPSSENTKVKWHGIELGMPDKIPTPEDLALLRGFEPKG